MPRTADIHAVFVAVPDSFLPPLLPVLSKRRKVMMSLRTQRCLSAEIHCSSGFADANSMPFGPVTH